MSVLVQDVSHRPQYQSSEMITDQQANDIPKIYGNLWTADLSEMDEPGSDY